MTWPTDKKHEPHARSASLLSLAASVWPAAGQDRSNGTIIKDEPCALPPFAYAEEVEQVKTFYEREAAVGRKHGLAALPYQGTYWPLEAEWDAMRAHEGFVCRQLRYMSDGLEINGFLYAPENAAGRSLPVIILNRGGNRDFMAWTPWRFIRTAYPLGQAGFVVLASQYRGGGGSQGQDEYGGADVDNVLNLISTAKSLSYSDPNNVPRSTLARRSPIDIKLFTRPFASLQPNVHPPPQFARCPARPSQGDNARGGPN